MALIDRFGPGADDNAIRIHQWRSALVLRKAGHITDQNVIDIFDLSGSDITDAQAFLALINSGSLTPDVAESVLILFQTGVLTRAQALNFMGF